MDIEAIMLSEITKKKQKKLYDLTYMRKLKTKNKNTKPKIPRSYIDTENKLLIARGGA